MFPVAGVVITLVLLRELSVPVCSAPDAERDPVGCVAPANGRALKPGRGNASGSSDRKIDTSRYFEARLYDCPRSYGEFTRLTLRRAEGTIRQESFRENETRSDATLAGQREPAGSVKELGNPCPC